MSWKTINEILNLALIDQEFCRELLANPLYAIQRHNLQLTEHEQQVISQIRAGDLTELSQHIMKQLAPKDI